MFTRIKLTEFYNHFLLITMIFLWCINVLIWHVEYGKGPKKGRVASFDRDTQNISLDNHFLPSHDDNDHMIMIWRLLSDHVMTNKRNSFGGENCLQMSRDTGLDRDPIESRHYGSKQLNAETFNHPLSHKLESKWASKPADKWALEAKQAVQSKRMNELCKRGSEWTSEWPSTYVSIHGCSEPQCPVLTPFT